MTNDDKVKMLLPSIGMLLIALSLGISLGWIYAVPFFCIGVFGLVTSSQARAEAKSSESETAS